MLDSKSATAAVAAFLHWVVQFGAPGTILSDDGGEFVNHLWRLMADCFGICLSSTAAQAPWSNGTCERHNAVFKHTFNKLSTAEPDASTQLLLDMACLAKNSLLVHGAATPHQLMCGSLPRLPAPLTDDPPALCDVRAPGDSQLLLTLRLLTKHRVAFLQAEADQSLRRAILRKTRAHGATTWTADTPVFFWHAGVSAATSGWRGPANVGGQTGRQVLLSHGGQWLTRDSNAVMAIPRLDAPSTATFEPLLQGAAPTGPDDDDADIPALIDGDWDAGGAPAAETAPSSDATGDMFAAVTAALARISSDIAAAGTPPAPDSLPAVAADAADATTAPPLVSGPASPPGAPTAAAAAPPRRSSRLRAQPGRAAPSVNAAPVDVNPADEAESDNDDEDSLVAQFDALVQAHRRHAPALAAGTSAPITPSLPVGGTPSRPPTFTPPYRYEAQPLLRPEPEVLLDQVGAEDLDARMRVGEQHHPLVHQVLVSRSEMRRRKRCR